MRGLNGIRVAMTAGLITMMSAGLAVSAPVASQAAVSPSGLYSFGSNTYGELGDGTTTASTPPVWLSGLPSPVIQVAASYESSAALLANGTVWTWGDNYYPGSATAPPAKSSTPRTRCWDCPLSPRSP